MVMGLIEGTKSSFVFDGLAMSSRSIDEDDNKEDNNGGNNNDKDDILQVLASTSIDGT